MKRSSFRGKHGPHCSSTFTQISLATIFLSPTNIFHNDLPMKLILCRHAETVDNVAGLYAGIRDSALTVHGVEQARRLGQHFAGQGTRFDHIFASPLTRTVKTAEAVRAAQRTLWPDSEQAPTIVRVQELIETSFGSLEGVSWSKKVDRSKDPGYEPVESKEETAKRADAFLDNNLLPLFDTEQRADLAVAVVSHGMLLSSLWKRLLLRLPRKSLAIAPEVTAARDGLILEHLGGWSNTGYLELELHRLGEDHPGPQGATSEAEVSPATKPTTPASPEKKTARVALQGWSTTIKAIDNRIHLVGLKRQRGGIGRLADDGKQKKLDGFFKRQKTS